MASLRNLLNRLAGIDDDGPRSLQVCAFGKHPASTEFIELNTGAGPARQVEAWLKSGHDQWIRHRVAGQRGKVVPAGLIATPPQLHPHRVAACIWPSRDSASPPRVFPLALFTVLRGAGDAGWADQFVLMTHLSRALAAVYGHVRDTDDLTPLRRATVDLSGEALTTLQADLRQRAENHDAAAWLEALAPAARCASGAVLAGLLRQRLSAWRKDRDNLAIRLPLTRQLDFATQGLVWMRWLAGHLGPDCPPLSAVCAPPDGEPEAQPAMALCTRPLATNDFQVVTTDAADYDFFEGLQAAAPPPEAPPLPTGQSLWTWSGGQA